MLDPAAGRGSPAAVHRGAGGQAGKNRIHFDLRPNAGTRAQEVARLVALGATVVADRSDIHGPGIGWVTMADPEGNEFCVLRSEAEIQATTEG